MNQAERKAFYISSGIHATFLLMLTLLALWSWLVRPKPEEPHIFEMVSPSPSPTQASTQTPQQLQQPSPPDVDLNVNTQVPELPEVIDFDLPELPPEPTANQPQQPTPPTPAQQPKRVTYDPTAYTTKPPQKAPATPSNRKPPPISLNAPKVSHPDNPLPTTSKPENTTNTTETTNATEVARYEALIYQKLNTTWAKPRGLTTTGLYARAIFTVEPGGKISGIRLVRTSGNATLDASVLEAFSNLTRVPPTPTGRSMQMQVTFSLDN